MEHLTGEPEEMRHVIDKHHQIEEKTTQQPAATNMTKNATTYLANICKPALSDAQIKDKRCN